MNTARETKLLESSIIQRHINDKENNMNAFVQRSFGIAIRKLRSRFFKGKSVDEIKAMIQATEVELNQLAAETSDFELRTSIEGLLAEANANQNFLDKVLLYVPVEGTHPTEYQEVIDTFPLKEVITLVWKATHSDKLFSRYASGDKETKSALKERRENLFLQFKLLDKEKPCHVGYRHQLLFPITATLKSLNVILNENTFILDFLNEHVLQLFMETRKKSDVTLETKKRLQAVLYRWIKETNLTDLLSILDPENKLLQQLQEIFIQHGTKPKDTEVPYRTCLQFIDIGFIVNPKKQPLFYYIYKLLTAQEINGNTLYNQFLKQVKEWIENEFDFENIDHLVLIEKMYAIHNAQCNLDRYDLLLVLDGKKARFEALEIHLQSYFSALAHTNSPQLKSEAFLTTTQPSKSIVEEEKTIAQKLADFSALNHDDWIRIRSLEDEIRMSQKSHLSDRIQSFFYHWYDAKRLLQTERLQGQYKILLSDEFQKAVRLNDDIIQKMIDQLIVESKKKDKDASKSMSEKLDKEIKESASKKTDKEAKGSEVEVLDLDEYHITRFFLHAILTDTEEWTPLFTRYLQTALDFVKKELIKDGRGSALREGSYPDSLLKQIEHLIKVKKGEPTLPPADMIILPQKISSIQDWLRVADWLDPKTKEKQYEKYCRPLQEAVKKEGLKQDNFYPITSSLPANKLLDFYKRIGFSQLVNIDFSFYPHWVNLFKPIPKDQINEFLNHLLNECEIQKKMNSHLIIPLFSHFATDIEAATRARIVDYYLTPSKPNSIDNLIQIFKYLSAQQKVTCLNRLNLMEISSNQLTKLVALFAPDEILPFLFRYVKEVKLTDKNIPAIFSLIPPEKLIEFFKEIGFSGFSDFVHILWMDDNKALEKFNKIQTDQMDGFLNWIIDKSTSDNVRILIHFHNAFADHLKENTTLRLIEIYQTSSLGMIECLHLMNQKNRAILLNKIEKSKITKEIKDADKLVIAFSFFPEDQRFSILNDLSPEQWQNWVEKETCYFMEKLPCEHREAFVSRLSFQCQTASEIGRIVALLPDNAITSFLKRTGKTFLVKFCKSSDLGGLLDNWPESHYEEILNFLEEDILTSNINGEDLGQVFERLAYRSDKLEKFIKFLGNDAIRDRLKTIEDLNSVLINLPDNLIKSFLTENLGSEFLNKLFFGEGERDYKAMAKLFQATDEKDYTGRRIRTDAKRELLFALKIAESPQTSDTFSRSRFSSLSGSSFYPFPPASTFLSGLNPRERTQPWEEAKSQLFNDRVIGSLQSRAPHPRSLSVYQEAFQSYDPESLLGVNFHRLVESKQSALNRIIQGYADDPIPPSVRMSNSGHIPRGTLFRNFLTGIAHAPRSQLPTTSPAPSPSPNPSEVD